MGSILEKETQEKFGYDIDTLKPNSCKLVLWQCLDCSCIKEKKYRDAKRHTYCLHCSNKRNAIKGALKNSKRMKEWYLTHDHPLKGTKRPPHVLKALRDAHLGKCYLTEEQKKEFSIRYRGKGNPFYGHTHTQETIDKIQEKISSKIKRGKESNLYGKVYHSVGQWYESGNQKIWMRSSWEVKYAHYLDQNEIRWEYEPKAFDIVLDGKEVSYRPDFLLIKENLYIEIKGYWRDDAKAKYECFKKTYPDIRIKLLMRKELMDLGIRL